MDRGLVVAITGQSGSGKSSLSKIYAKAGHTVIDCDRIAAEIHLKPDCIESLVACFGTEILTDESKGKADSTAIAIDKKNLARIAFNSKENLNILTKITHPFIIKEILRTIEEEFEKGKRIVFVDGAVIIGYEFEKYCDKIIVIVSSKENQYKRLMTRDNITTLQAQNRIDKQMTVERMVARADFIVYNNSTQESLATQAENIISQIINV